MKAHRVTGMWSSASLLAGAAIAAFAPVPAAAQVPDDVVLAIMRECAKVDDPTARLACYDNNIRAGGFDGRRPVVPGAQGAVSGSGAPVASSGSPQGFGAEDIKREDRFESSESRGLGPDEVRARISDISQRQPGVYLVTLDGGAQWLFTESVGRSFRVPRRGDTVEIRRASLGSFLMQVEGQESVRVRRVR